MKSLQNTIKIIVRRGEESGYVAECVEIAVVTQGETRDEAVRNLREAVALRLEDEDLAALGLAESPTLIVTMEVEPYSQSQLENRVRSNDTVVVNLKFVTEPGEDGYFVAHCPSLKRCWSQGKTREEVLQNLREAIDLYLEPSPSERRFAP